MIVALVVLALLSIGFAVAGCLEARALDRLMAEQAANTELDAHFREWRDCRGLA